MKKSLLLIFLFFGYNSFAQLVEQKLQASDGLNGNRFGSSVAVSDNYAFIGAPGDDEYGTNSGAVYIFKKTGNNWIEAQKLTDNNGHEGEQFGFALSVCGDFLVIGAPAPTSSSGKVHIYKLVNDSWNEIQISFTSNLFTGQSVSISGSYIMVGSSERISIYHLEDSIWVWKQNLVSSDHEAGDKFGFSVSISGEHALVGAYFDDNENGWNAGAVYLFKLDNGNWIEKQKIIASDTLARNFGYSVSLSGNKAIIGAPWDDTNAPLAGAAIIFEMISDTLVEYQKIMANDGKLDDQFGNSVSILGNYAIVGAYHVDSNGTDAGASYVFKFGSNSWIEDQKIIPSNVFEDMKFGSSVGISENYILIGAPATYAYPHDTLGFAYVYSGIVTGINDNISTNVFEYNLEQNYPNPFNPSTVISYKIPLTGFVTIKIFDLLGNEIATLVNEEKPAGKYEVDFAASNLASGVYIYRIKVDNPESSSGQVFTESKKMLLIK